MSEELNKNKAVKKYFPMLLMLSLIGLASLISGIGASYYLSNQSDSSKSGTKSSLHQEFLAVPWQTPSTGPADLSQLQSKILVINFWASWCPPCVEEMPMLSELSKQLDPNAFQMLGVGIDSPSNIREFLTKTAVSYPILNGGMDGSQWMKQLNNTQGALPYTVILSPKGELILTKLGKISEEEIRSALLKTNK